MLLSLSSQMPSMISTLSRRSGPISASMLSPTFMKLCVRNPTPAGVRVCFATRKYGVDRHGEPTSTFQIDLELHAKYALSAALYRR